MAPVDGVVTRLDDPLELLPVEVLELLDPVPDFVLLDGLPVRAVVDS